MNDDIYGEDDVLINGDIPNKLIYSLSHFKNEISSEKIKYVIKDTRGTDTTVNSLIQAA